MLKCRKVYRDIPFAHRAPHHDGHCKLIHGHNWTFEIEFAGEPDVNGFVMDFGKLHELRDALMEIFDHKLLLNEDDPLAEEIVAFLRMMQLDNVTLVEDCSCEGIAKLVFKLAAAAMRKQTGDRVSIERVTVLEDQSNSASYHEFMITELPTDEELTR
jgi:6-pyruvoyl-tetrahydropterin synthase